jgi:lysyl-tRNA synthetase class II
MAIDDFRNDRIAKLRRLQEAGIDPFPATTERDHSVREVLDGFDALLIPANILPKRSPASFAPSNCAMKSAIPAPML